MSEKKCTNHYMIKVTTPLHTHTHTYMNILYIILFTFSLFSLSLYRKNPVWQSVSFGNLSIMKEKIY